MAANSQLNEGDDEDHRLDKDGLHRGDSHDDFIAHTFAKSEGFPVNSASGFPGTERTFLARICLLEPRLIWPFRLPNCVGVGPLIV